MENNPLELFLSLYKKLKSKILSDSKVAQGTVLLDEAIIDQLLVLESTGVFLGTVKRTGETRSINLDKYKDKLVGHVVEVELIYGELEVYENWDSFFAVKANRYNINHEFSIISEDCMIFRSGVEHSLYNRYENLVKILLCLKSTADHIIDNDRWVFSRRSKVELIIDFNQEQLVNADLDGYTLFLSTLLDEEKYSDEKQSIIQDVLSKMLSSKSLLTRFPWLLKNFKEFFVQFEYGYRMFVCNFSFDKIRKEYEEKYREYSVKLNSVLSDVSTKALAVPAAMVFCISKFDRNLTTLSILSNWLMVCGVLLFCLLISSLAYSHMQSLSAIEDEFKGLLSRLYLELPDDNSDDPLSISQLLEKLKNRKIFIWWLLVGVICVSVLCFLIAVGFSTLLYFL